MRTCVRPDHDSVSWPCCVCGTTVSAKEPHLVLSDDNVVCSKRCAALVELTT